MSGVTKILNTIRKNPFQIRLSRQFAIQDRPDPFQPLLRTFDHAIGFADHLTAQIDLCFGQAACQQPDRGMKRRQGVVQIMHAGGPVIARLGCMLMRRARTVSRFGIRRGSAAGNQKHRVGVGHKVSIR